MAQDDAIALQNIAGSLKTPAIDTARYEKASELERRYLDVSYWTAEQAASIKLQCGIVVGAAGTGKSYVLKAKVLKLLKTDDRDIVIMASNAMYGAGVQEVCTLFAELDGRTAQSHSIRCHGIFRKVSRVLEWPKSAAKIQQKLKSHSGCCRAVAEVVVEVACQDVPMTAVDLACKLMMSDPELLHPMDEAFSFQQVPLRALSQRVPVPELDRTKLPFSQMGLLKDSCESESEMPKSLVSNLVLLDEILDIRSSNQLFVEEFSGAHVFCDDFLALEVGNLPQLLVSAMAVCYREWVDEPSVPAAHDQSAGANARAARNATTTPKM